MNVCRLCVPNIISLGACLKKIHLVNVGACLKDEKLIKKANLHEN